MRLSKSSKLYNYQKKKLDCNESIENDDSVFSLTSFKQKNFYCSFKEKSEGLIEEEYIKSQSVMINKDKYLSSDSTMHSINKSQHLEKQNLSLKICHKLKNFFCGIC